MKIILIKLIEVYQRTLSPDNGWMRGFYPNGYCKFTPSCSDYSKEAIMNLGAIRGSVLGFWRILRCNPWSRGGYDPVRTISKKPHFAKATKSRQATNKSQISKQR